jgi:hypothetical protein
LQATIPDLVVDHGRVDVTVAELALQGVERHPGLRQIGCAGVPESMGMNPWRLGALPCQVADGHPGAIPERLTEAKSVQADEDMVVFHGDGRSSRMYVLRARSASVLSNATSRVRLGGSHRDPPLGPVDVTEPEIEDLTDPQNCIFE